MIFCERDAAFSTSRISPFKWVFSGNFCEKNLRQRTNTGQRVIEFVRDIAASRPIAAIFSLCTIRP